MAKIFEKQKKPEDMNCGECERIFRKGRLISKIPDNFLIEGIMFAFLVAVLIIFGLMFIKMFVLIFSM